MGTTIPRDRKAGGKHLPQRCTLIDVETRLKEISMGRAALAISLAMGALALLAAGNLPAQTAVSGPPPSSGGFFPLSEVHKGLMATAWTVFEGDKPEPMQVEILGILRGARGPGKDMILAQLHGAKPEYTGVVAGMSGSPVYIGNRLLGSLSYRIGQFSKDPIAGITPIEQMLEVRDMPIQGTGGGEQGTGIREQGSGNAAAWGIQADGMNFQAMETPLVMSGFQPGAIELWKKQMAGTGLEMVAAGGVGGSSEKSLNDEPSAKALATMVPGSAVSALLVRGDIEISATCTVTYIDPKQLLACGHPLMQSGPVSLPMTTTEVVATLASPLNAFKIVNTGELIGAFTEDRDSAIRGVLGLKPHMIPVHIAVHSPSGDRKLNLEVLDLPALTPQAMLVSLYESLLESNQSSDETSYHVTGSIELAAYPPSPIDEWASAGESGSASLTVALLAATRFNRIYSNGARQGDVQAVDLHVEAIPRHVDVQLETARIVSGDILHAGDTVVVEATIRPWQQPARNVRIPVKLPQRLGGANLRILVSDAGTLDHTLDQPRFSARPADLKTVLAQARAHHSADRIYVSLLVPETQAGVGGEALTSLPLSVANALEPLRTAQDVSLNGESAALAADVPAGGVLSGFQILNLRIEPGGSLN
jgi:SpoIVB peptidase S55